MIYHITAAHEWDTQKHEPVFVPRGYHQEGFVHCCTREQLAGVRVRYFGGETDLVMTWMKRSSMVN